MDATYATYILRDAGLDAYLADDVILVSQPWSPDTVITVPVHDDVVEQWRIEVALLH